jgi:type III restriction enzyme
MAEKFLYEKLVEEFGKRSIADIPLPKELTENLNPKFELRPYQIEAFQRFLCYFEKDFDFKQDSCHVLFNMATGSGKTLIMAGLILYLYEKGYRNFLFFVNSTNIINKTESNFLEDKSNKYLFADKIVFGTKRIKVSQVDTFDAASTEDINICFSTIHQLHSDLHNEKENSLTYEDFKDKKIVLIADEAHHINVTAKGQRDIEELTWENTVQKIFEQNADNLLLEFTATLDYEHSGIVDKYRNKVIYRYDLKQFREDGFSKDVYIVQSDLGHNQRILQALILSEYKQLVAAKNKINLKPVILFKAQKTIAQSKDNKENFHNLIDNLAADQIEEIKKGTDIALVKKAFAFFAASGITNSQLVKRLKAEFHQEKCLSVNEESEKEARQLMLNSLEDKNNPIRAIFAVQKLNEGWDVLNLFDIVRCYEQRDSKSNKPGRTTISEAQLIGRGARYFPFVTADNEDRFRRKFDKDLEKELRVLEQLHYHSINDSRYIAEIRKALAEKGMLDENIVQKQLTLKESFRKTAFFKTGSIYINKKVPSSYNHVTSFADLGVKKKNFRYKISSGKGSADMLLEEQPESKKNGSLSEKDIGLKNMPRHVIQNAVSRNPFFSFKNLKRYNIESIDDFIDSTNYLAGLGITFFYGAKSIELSNKLYLQALDKLLEAIESEIDSATTEYQGTKTFDVCDIKVIFDDKTLNIDSKDERAKGDEDFVQDKGWYAFNANYGTSEEKDFVHMLARQIDELEKKYENIYLIRNERHFKIFNFSDGRAFEPDFVLFLKQKDGEFLTYQLFIEPKGKHIKTSETEKWKEKFLQEIKQEFKGKLLSFNSKDKYRITGVPFYNNQDENPFKESLCEALKD